MPPLSLSDSELQTLIEAASPLAPDRRAEFLQTVAAELGKHRELGEGLVARTCREAQRKVFAPPNFRARGTRDG
jgi:hypothetical protein